jgi:type II secretory pathway component PulM
MSAPKIDVGAYAARINEEISILAGTLKEKGAKRFGRALGAAAVMLVVAYAGIYSPSQSRSARLDKEFARVKTLVDYGAKYKDLRDQLGAAYAVLPAEMDRAQWLSNAVRDSLLAGSLVTENFTPIRESEVNGLVFQNSSVSLTVRFEDFFNWLLRVESAKPLMHMSSIELGKKNDRLGFNGATCELATVIPKKRYR